MLTSSVFLDGAPWLVGVGALCLLMLFPMGGFCQDRPATFTVSTLDPVPEAPRPEPVEREAFGLSAGTIDFQAVKALDDTIRYDESNAPADTKAEHWDALAAAHPSYIDLATQRAGVWREYACRVAEAEQIRRRRMNVMKSDWEALSHLLNSEGPTNQEKQFWIGEFTRVYGVTPDKNPYIAEMTERLLSFQTDVGETKEPPPSHSEARPAVASSVPFSLEWVPSPSAGLMFTRSEVTTAQYSACVEAGKCIGAHHRTNEDNRRCNWGADSHQDHPMNCIDWIGADVFCKQAGGRLPSVEEWEAEASDGGQRIYPWGSQAPNRDYAVMDEAGNEYGEGGTEAVCSRVLGQSVSGLCGFAGNVAEWTSSWFGSRRTHRVVRGGSWRDAKASYFRASSPGRLRNMLGDDEVGFRCVRTWR